MAKTWLRAPGWWAADYVYAVNRQARSVFGAADAAGLLTGERAPLVVIPGVYEPWQFLAPLVAAAHERGHPVHVIESLGYNVRPVVESAALVDQYLEAAGLDGAIILAHSKGGLIGKQVMVGKQGGRIAAMLCIATPFQGSEYARFMLAPRLRIFSPTDSTIRALASDAEVNARIVSIYGAFDPHIPRGSELEGATNVRLDTGGHFRILRDPRILAELDQLATRPTGASGPV